MTFGQAVDKAINVHQKIFPEHKIIDECLVTESYNSFFVELKIKNFNLPFYYSFTKTDD